MGKNFPPTIMNVDALKVCRKYLRLLSVENKGHGMGFSGPATGVQLQEKNGRERREAERERETTSVPRTSKLSRRKHSLKQLSNLEAAWYLQKHTPGWGGREQYIIRVRYRAHAYNPSIQRQRQENHPSRTV